MQKSRQAINTLIEESQKNQQLSQDLVINLEKCFYAVRKGIAEKCRYELIQRSTFVQYRGSKVYKPPENDRDIKYLEVYIKELDKKLKQLHLKKSEKNIQEILTQISLSSHQSVEETKLYLEQLYLKAEKDCPVSIYKAALRDKENGLQQQIFKSMLLELEENEKLNQIFDIQTYLTLTQMFQKYQNQ
ncbi:hypothetical protein [Calothrix sp. NIES-3974]|uniref:hypothetical protein n=1 Tax=Calothrix sp. NIES-3974 TaxID=2005462 RepID=UPI0012FD8095|nr:hypothetical protein [Calothrix sp. NIES-3974]